MKQVTIRRVSERSLKAAKKLARERGVSMNAVLVEALDRGLGTGGHKATNGLERFAADSDFGPGWDAYLEELRRVDPEDWR